MSACYKTISTKIYPNQTWFLQECEISINLTPTCCTQFPNDTWNLNKTFHFWTLYLSQLFTYFKAHPSTLMKWKRFIPNTNFDAFFLKLEIELEELQKFQNTLLSLNNAYDLSLLRLMSLTCPSFCVTLSPLFLIISSPQSLKKCIVKQILQTTIKS